jgi:hypothetical protein
MRAALASPLTRFTRVRASAGVDSVPVVAKSHVERDCTTTPGGAADMTSEQAYRIIVDGEFGEWLAHYVGDATLDAADGITTIVGVVKGPNELHTLSAALWDMGLEIKSARLL